MPSETTVRECQFPGCEWSKEHGDSYSEELSRDFDAERHYEREHGGRIRIQVTLEAEQILGGRDPKDVRKQWMEDYDDSHHIDVAYVRTEVLEESDNHAVLEGDDE